MAEMSYFKITRDHRSMRVFGLAKVTYTEGEWADAPVWLAERGYHLLVFGSYADAKAFIFRSSCNPSPFRIWECEVEGLAKELPPICCLTSLADGVIRINSDLGAGWPIGTLMARRVKLLRLIEGDY